MWRDSPKSVFNLISVTDTTAAGDDSPGYRVDDYVKSVTKRYDAVGNARAEALFAIKQGAVISSTITFSVKYRKVAFQDCRQDWLCFDFP